jgi:RNA-directed DNA polymerase
MEESHVEGVATHDGPRSCAAAREGVGEAFDRGTCGPGIEPRNAQFRGADAVMRGGRQHGRHRNREMLPGPARSETPCTYGTSLRENREICGLLGAVARRVASGRP